ncbi:Phage capsid and scaffold [Pseudomonas chlororaphis subsp. aureofaciens]|uniref:major capsid family protein n=1 Tax=Pseudomonas chlororaphis TaxID=587753 RepID=UPI000F5771D2|nr:major capsid family protein [Pseudomonas chlororaphis]AZD85003.1 Phage capsid and scaffold [Pseudomonas chlororaphis subsp. aureofaciens]
MRSPESNFISGRALASRGPLLIKPEHVQHYGQLAKVGIGLDGIAMDTALTGPVIGAAGTPAQFLQNWLPGLVRQITKVRLIDELAGVQTIGSWEDEEVIQGTMEATGKAELYGDSTNIPYANYKNGYERRTIVRFEQGFHVGRLEEARAAKANINMAAEKRNAATESLDISRNRVGFVGYNAPDTRTYGYLNDPQLPAYVSLPVAWPTATYLQLTAAIRRMVSDLIASGGGHITNKTPMTLSLPLGYGEYLGVTPDFGNSVQDWVTKTYPNLRILEVPEQVGANGGANVAYIYADAVDDGSTDDGRTLVQIVPARFQVIGTEQRAKGYLEDFTNATAGVMFKRPWAVRRYTGL